MEYKLVKSKQLRKYGKYNKKEKTLYLDPGVYCKNAPYFDENMGLYIPKVNSNLYY